MTDEGSTADQPPVRRGPVAARLLAAREQSGLSLEDAASASCIPHLADLESGYCRPTSTELDLLSATYGVDLSDLLKPRRDVVFDPATGDLTVSGVTQRVRDVGDRDALFRSYLFLLYAVRGAQRGREVPLRAADLDALLAVVGGEPARIEERLVELMGCSREEAPLLRRVLLRHRTAVAGAAVGLSLVSFVAAYAASDDGTIPVSRVGTATGSGQASAPQTGTLTADEPCLAEATPEPGAPSSAGS